MAMRKQEFYEGAALHALARTGRITGIKFEPPFFVLNGNVPVLLKYSTRGRSPWGFTFTPDEQQVLRTKAMEGRTIIALICGADGIAAFDHAHYTTIAAVRKASLHIACYRQHGQHYEICGPDGTLVRKIPPSGWQRILESGSHS